jgi:pleiotropic regulator 1
MKRNIRLFQVLLIIFIIKYVGGSDNIKVWKCPEGRFLRNISGHNAIINSVALNKDGVLVSGADNGTLNFWDYRSGALFQQEESKVQSGSLSSEAGIFAIKFDKSSTRMITAECDKTIKMWKEDENATPENFPLKY